MTRRRATASIVASPVLVGAVTVLVAIIAVFIAYNANAGLPFVPTYDVRAEIPGGANLVAGNEVRLGGFRVGVVETIRPGVAQPGERGGNQPDDARSIAVLDLKLDKRIEPVPVDSRIAVRPRSALGLKYVDLKLGEAARDLPPGGTLPLSQALKPVELDEFFSTFDDDMRVDQRTVLEGYGNALAGRGAGINRAIEDLVPLLRALEPVARTLSAPRTGLGEFVRQSRVTAGQVAPVAPTYAALFSNMATTFEALSRHPDRLTGAMERLRPTLDEGVRSLPAQRPFLRDTTELAARLEPVADEMERSLPVVTSALRTGAPVLEKAPPFYERTENVFAALTDLAENPNTLLALSDLRRTLEVAAPLLQFVAPYQTVCNYWNYFWTGLGEHVSEDVRNGYAQRVNLKLDNRFQDNRMSDSAGDRPADVPSDKDPRTERLPTGAVQALHRQGYQPVIDAQGNADCQIGQRGYVTGPMVTGGRYPPSTDRKQGGGSHVVLDSDMPGLAGGTYKTRELGIRNLRDVP